MISPVSFKSTYKVNNQNPNSNVRFNVFRSYAEQMAKSTYFADTIYKKETVKKSFFGSLPAKEEETLIVSDETDKSVEDFCKQNGIKFEKLYAHDLLDTRKIKSRIQEAPRGYKKVDVNVKQLEKLIQSQKSNIPTCKNEYECIYMPAVKATVLEGSDFSATTLRIDPMEGYFCSNDFKGDALEKYIKTHGVQNLNNQQTGIYFVNSEDNIDCYTYFLLRDLGMEKIPVYIDDLTYRAGSSLGLFE